MKNSDFDQGNVIEDILSAVRKEAETNPRKALELADTALKEKIDPNNREGIIKIQVERGRLFRRLEEYHKAVEVLTTAVNMAELINNGKLIKMASNSLGILYRQIGDFEQALDVYNRMLSRTDLQHEPEYYAYILNNIGVAYRHLDERGKALDHYNKSLDLYELARDDKGYSDTLNNIGLIYSDLGQPDIGLDYFNKSLEIRKNIENTQGIAVSYHNIGLASFKCDRLDDAVESYERSIEMFREMSNSLGIAKTEEALGEVKMKLGDLDKAEEHFVTALDMSVESGNMELEESVYEKLSYLAELRKDYKTALEYHKKFCSLGVKSAERLRRDMFERVSIKFEIEKKEMELAREKALSVMYDTKRKELNKLNTLISKKNRELEEAAKKLRELADYDQLTGLPNRRSAWERLNLEVTRNERNKKPFSVVMADLDNFKKFNDEMGHDCGDKLLGFVSEIMEKHVRKQDMVARWGGEEFLFILPETDEEGGCELARKICAAVAETAFDYNGRESKVTVTMGLAVYDGSNTVEYVIDSADKAMYTGKQSGKNRVCSA